MGIDRREGKEGMETRQKRSNDDIREAVFERDNHTCQYCGDKYDEAHRLNVVLKTPIAEGGENSIENRETRCDRCVNTRRVPKSSGSDNLNTQLVRGLKAIDKANTVQSFAEDAREIVKIGLAIPSIPIAVITLGVNSQAVTDVSIFDNVLVWLGFVCWLLSLFIFGGTYYSARTSSPSPTMVEAAVDEDGTTDVGEKVKEETESSYHRNAGSIAAGMVLLALSVILFSLGSLTALDLLEPVL